MRFKHGELKTNIKLFRLVTADDGMGGRTESYALYRKTKAKVNFLRGTDADNNSRRENLIEATVIIRNTKDLQPTDMVEIVHLNRRGNIKLVGDATPQDTFIMFSVKFGEAT